MGTFGALLGAMLIVATGTAGSAAGATLKVAAGGSDTGNCQTHPCASLGYAITQAGPGGTILIEPGTYAEGAGAGTSSVNTIGATLTGLTIESDPASSGTAANTIIDATGSNNGLVISANDVTVQGLTIEKANQEGILITPPATAKPPISVTGVTVTESVVDENDQCGLATAPAKNCPPPNPEDDFGESIHLMSVANSTISDNKVDDNVGGILLTDEVGPTDGNTITGNDVSNDKLDCGITLAGHSPDAVATSGPDAGKPVPAAGGVYNNMITHNTANGNGAAGLLAAGGGPGSAVYDNSYIDNTADGNGLAGFTLHSHAPFQDINGNVVTGNTFSHDGIAGGPAFAAGDTDAATTQSAGVTLFTAFAPVTGTVVTGNTISGSYYGVWSSTLAAFASKISGNTITVTAGGSPVYVPPAPGSGYVLAGSDGSVYASGTASSHGSATTIGKVAGIAFTPDRDGYWLVGTDGTVAALGDAIAYGSRAGKDLAAPIVGIAATPDGGGYWLVAADGGIFNYGDAGFFGSAGAEKLAAPIVGIAATPDGGGYWLVAADGGIFNYGDAPFLGSAGGKKLTAPIVGMAPTAPDVSLANGSPFTAGYWLVGADGAVYNFGNAVLFGSAAGTKLGGPIVAIQAAPPPPGLPKFSGGSALFSSDGYRLIGADGGVLTFGSSHFAGSAAGHVSAPVVGAAQT